MAVVLSVDEVPQGSGKVVTADGKAIAVFNVDGRCYALDNVCPHRQGPLARGRLEGATVRCPMHGWLFDLRTGACLNQPQQAVRSYPVRIEGDQCLIG